jgi:hypothetical protein
MYVTNWLHDHNKTSLIQSKKDEGKASEKKFLRKIFMPKTD